jgi:hypothetical protein
MEVGLGRASRKRSKRDAKAVWTLSMKVGDWVYREDTFVSTLSVQGISWGMHRVTQSPEWHR